MIAPHFLACVVGILLLAHLVLLGFFKISSLDTWFHLKEGELYVTTHSLPVQDPFAFTTQGRQWIKYSWLADIFFYLIYAATGLTGLVLLRICLLFLLSFFLYRILRGVGLHPLASVLLVFVASLALRFRLFIRPEILSFLLLLAVMAILFRLHDAPRWAAYTLLPVQVIWTNVHASFVFGIGLPGLVFLANLLPGERATPGWGHLRLDRVRLRHLALTVASLPLATLLNPHGVSLLLFPFRQNQMVRLTIFPEWMGVWHLPEMDPVLWETVIIFGVILLAFAAVSVLLMIREGRLDPVGWGVVCSMGGYAIWRNRAIPFFVLAVLPLLATALVRVATHLRDTAQERPIRWLERAGVLACLLLLCASIVDQGFLTRRFAPGFGVAPYIFPEEAAAFLERHHLDGRIFNTYSFGAYLMWRRWPANQVFIDGRYDTVLFSEGLLEEYIRAHRDPAALERIAQEYGVEILILDASSENRIAYLTRPSPWARVYWDSVAEVLVRRTEHYAAFITAHEYRLTDPTTDLSYLVAYRRDPEIWNRAMAELRRAVQDNPKNEIAWQALAQEEGVAGPTALPQRLEALTQVTTLLADNAGVGRYHAERAEVLLQLGRPDEAVTAAREALRVDGELLRPHWVLAAVAEERGAWTEAQDQLRTMLKRMEPDHPMMAAVRHRLEAVDRRLGGGTAQGDEKGK
jgi:tetratricopeptide (TPR) repeat protein